LKSEKRKKGFSSNRKYLFIRRGIKGERAGDEINFKAALNKHSHLEGEARSSELFISFSTQKNVGEEWQNIPKFTTGKCER
jgi:hypothetical protein